jgi:hypothetical protein
MKTLMLLSQNIEMKPDKFYSPSLLDDDDNARIVEGDGVLL